MPEPYARLDAAVAAATRRSRRIAPLALLGVFAVIVSLAVLYAQARANLRDAQLANVALQRAHDRAKLEAVVANDNAKVSAETLEAVRAAFEAGNRAETKQALARAVIRAEELAEAPQKVAEAPTRLTPAQASAVVDVAPTYAIPANTARYPQEVYIQFAGVLTRAEITAFNRSLKAAGWAVQGASGERLPSAAGKSEVRYSGANAAAAAALAGAIGATGIIGRPVVAVENPDIRSNQLEIWISR